MAKETSFVSADAQNRFGTKNAALLQALVYASPKLRRAIIKHADKSLVRLICECSLNVLRGAVPLKESDKKSLKKYRKALRRLIDKRNKSLLKRKKILNQSGGSILPILIAPVISALISKLV